MQQPLVLSILMKILRVELVEARSSWCYQKLSCFLTKSGYLAKSGSAEGVFLAVYSR
jgi:hypothetical protein